MARKNYRLTNFYVDEDADYILRIASIRTKKSKTRILNELIKKELIKYVENDEYYRNRFGSE